MHFTHSFIHSYVSDLCEHNEKELLRSIKPVTRSNQVTSSFIGPSQFYSAILLTFNSAYIWRTKKELNPLETEICCGNFHNLLFLIIISNEATFLLNFSGNTRIIVMWSLKRVRVIIQVAQFCARLK